LIDLADNDLDLMRLEGVQRKAYLRRGAYIDALLMARVRRAAIRACDGAC
jgi:hypothetical protein